MNRRRPPLIIRIRQAFGRLGQRLADVGAALVWPIERGVQLVGSALFGVSERLNDADSLLVWLARMATWPVRALWQVVRALGALVFPLPYGVLWRRRLPRFGDFAAGLGGGLWRLAEKLNLDGLVLWVAWLTQPVWRPVAAVGGFLYAWLATRHYRGLLWGLPAVVLLLPVLAAATWALAWSHSAAEGYKIAVKAALDKKDYARMQLLERKLAQLGVDTQHTDYQTAMALAEGGKIQEAYERMRRLAPEDRDAYPPAHAWILQNALIQKLDLPQEERLRLAGVHLEHLKALSVNGPDFELLEGIWLAQSNRLEEASATLAPLITRNMFAAMERMRIDAILDRTEETRRDARAVRDHMQDAKRRGLPLDAEQYKAWTAAEDLLGNSSGLDPVVREWYKAAPKDALARQSVAALDLAQFNEMLQSPTADARQMAQRLIEMIELSDHPERSHAKIVALYQQRKAMPLVGRLIDELVKSPETPLTVADALGTAAALGNEHELARSMLKRVVDAQPKNAVAWNNYAWTLSQEPGRDLEQALAASNQALALVPQEFRFRETRGQILVGLGRWQEAVDDLEYALNGMPEEPAVHASLARAYEGLGQKNLAEVHRQQAP